MGIVFLARDVSLQRHVALKLLLPELADRPGMRERFVREARTAARLSHPNIVPIHAVEEAGDFVFFVMPYVDGETLAERVAARGALRPAEAIPILREVAWALAYAHAQGVVHRDVKPENILLERGTNRALVTDFGIAVVGGTSADELAEVVGTPDFMSPEQIMGGEVGPACDIYSLGAVACYLLRGRPPFQASTQELVLAKHLEAAPPKLGTEVPPAISAVVERCLAKAPADRVASGEELAALLVPAGPSDGDVPVALRLHLERTRTREGQLLLYLFLWISVAPAVAWPLLWMMFAGGPAAKLIGWSLAGLLVAAPVALPLSRIRKLLKEGLQREDLIRAIEVDAARRREELVYLYGADFKEKEERLHRGSVGGFATGAALVVGTMLAAASGADGPMAAMFLLASAGTLVGSGIAGSMASRRSDRKWLRRIKFWKSKLGRWMFRLAGTGLAHRDAPAVLANRPTEVALGMSVVGLFEALPRETRNRLGDLPAVVSGLEQDAAEMRARIARLDILIGASDDTRDSAAIRPEAFAMRRASRERLREQREEAAGRLGDAMTALETLRIDLIRMRSGSQDLDHLTANLGSARELSEQIDRLLEAHRELDDELGSSG